MDSNDRPEAKGEVQFKDADAKQNRHLNNMPNELDLVEFDVVDGTSMPLSPDLLDKKRFGTAV